MVCSKEIIFTLWNVKTIMQVIFENTVRKKNLNCAKDKDYQFLGMSKELTT